MHQEIQAALMKQIDEKQLNETIRTKILEIYQSKQSSIQVCFFLLEMCMNAKLKTITGI